MSETPSNSEGTVDKSLLLFLILSIKWNPPPQAALVLTEDIKLGGMSVDQN